MAAIDRKTITIYVVKKAKRYSFVRSMGSMAIHNNQSSIRRIIGLRLRVIYIYKPEICDIIICSTVMQYNKIPVGRMLEFIKKPLSLKVFLYCCNPTENWWGTVGRT
jgi:hypothetical protein